jgi:hypothetical protein
MSKKYILLESKYDGKESLQLTCEPYSGIIFSYGKVSFAEDETNSILRLNFEYDIHDNASKVFDKTLFENYLGDLLQELIHDGIEKNSITYTGGIDENRAEDSDESNI